MLDFFFICNIYKFTRDEDTDEVTAVATVTLRSLISLLTHIICNGNWQTTGRTWAKAHGSLKEEPKQKKKKHRVSLKNILSMYTIHGEKCSSVSATVGQYYLYYTVSGGEARKKKGGKRRKILFHVACQRKPVASMLLLLPLPPLPPLSEKTSSGLRCVEDKGQYLTSIYHNHSLPRAPSRGSRRGMK